MNGKVQSYLFIRKHAEKYPITRLVQITGVSRSGYYKWVKRNGENRQDIEDEKLRPILTKIFEEEHGLIGRKRMKLALFEQHNLVMNEKRVRRLMLKYGLYCKIRRKRFKHQPDPHAIIPNILNRNFKAVRPGIKFSIDITYIPVSRGNQKWVYLCAIKDLFNGEIVAYSMDTSQKTKLVYQTLEKLKEKGFEKGAILHSDQGTQFTNPGYQMRVKKMDLTQSMSRRGNCWDNACIENFFSHLKVEMPFISQPETVDEVYLAVADYINYYNHKRIQVKLKTSPVNYRLKIA